MCLSLWLGECPNVQKLLIGNTEKFSELVKIMGVTGLPQQIARNLRYMGNHGGEQAQISESISL